MEVTNDLLSKTVNNLKELYLSKKLNLLEYYNYTIISMSTNSTNYITELNSILVDFKDVLDKTNTCIKNCDDMLKLIETDTNIEEIDRLFNEIISFTTTIDSFMKNNLLKSKLPLNKQENSDTNVQNVKVDTSDIVINTSVTVEDNIEKTEELSDNNVLLISEKLNKVFLPYKICDLKKLIKNNNSYNNIQELINTKCIIPLDNFQNPVVARFKEAFSLIKDKEKRKRSFRSRTWS